VTASSGAYRPCVTRLGGLFIRYDVRGFDTTTLEHLHQEVELSRQRCLEERHENELAAHSLEIRQLVAVNDRASQTVRLDQSGFNVVLLFNVNNVEE
jgi:hypothetical protein